jgi:hypothetical protein
MKRKRKFTGDVETWRKREKGTRRALGAQYLISLFLLHAFTPPVILRFAEVRTH